MTHVIFLGMASKPINRKTLLTITIIILITLPLAIYITKPPTARAQTSQLSITGLVQNPLTLTLSQIEAMPQTTENASLVCVDAPSIILQQGNWTGVQLSYLLQQANVSSNAIKVAFHATDGFATDLTVQTALQDDAIIVAYQFNGAPLIGFRLVVPYEYGYKWIDDLTQIKLVNYNFLGTEESAGYSDSGVGSATQNPPATNNGPSGFSGYSVPYQTIPPQSPSSAPTGSPQPSAAASPSTAPAVSNPKVQPTTGFIFYIATASAVAAILIVGSVVALTRRTRAKAMKPSLDDLQVAQMANLTCKVCKCGGV
jgi:hypothetical protein